jgi:hypothetical protein
MGESALGVVALLALAGVVLLRGNRSRTGALLVMALALGTLGVDLLAGWLAPRAHGAGSVKTTEPRDWMPPDPVLGYRPLADTRVKARETFDGRTVYDVTYTILPDRTRATRAAPAGADTYIFLGDSFMFGEGLNDDDTLPAQFAREAGSKVKAVNFSASGWAPNHWVRAVEAGLLDPYRTQPVKALVTWIIPAHLARVTGDGSWLASSPRYVLDNGSPRFTGSFSQHRWADPIDGLRYFAEEQFPFVRAIGERQRQAEQGELFIALMTRLRALAREKFNAPLLVIYSWRDDASWPDENVSPTDHPPLVRLLDRLRGQRMAMLFVDHETKGYPSGELQIPHNGHPSAFANRLVARELRRRLLELPAE